MPTPGIAANAYAQLARITEAAGLAKTPASAPESPPDPASGFGAMLREAINGVDAAGHKSDVQAQALATGKANVIDVVTAVAEAETAVSALVAVRDNVIASYQEIMRMAI
jgi:flagellar hook-basal body complex protein FliE